MTNETQTNELSLIQEWGLNNNRSVRQKENKQEVIDLGIEWLNA
jgi:NAD-dependent DNA ligase